MAVDTSRMSRRGGDPDYDSGQIRGIREERGIVEGIVKANVHPTHMGVISVFIPRFGNDESNKEQWRQVKYCSPFYSRTNAAGPAENFLDVKTTGGIITPPPDLGTKVLCFFPDGRNAAGYYFACVPDTYMMQTIPEASVNKDGEAGTEFNDDIDSNNIKKINNFTDPIRPLDVYTQGQLIAAGLETDTVRGTSTSTVMRESPSEVIGIASKGRRITNQGLDFLQTYKSQVQNPNTTDKKILQGLLNPTYRKKGHSIALDDGDIDGASNQIRFRTSTGHQILLNDSEGVIYISNRAGTAWVELGSAGTMDVYAKDSINFRTKDFNVHADGNIKMHSKGYSQFVSDQQLQVQSKSQTVISSQGETGVSGSSGLHLQSGSDLRASSSSGMYLNTGGIMSVKGSLVLLQGPPLPAKSAKNIPNTVQQDTQFDQAQGKWVIQDPLQTSVDRAVTHEPYPLHNQPNQPSPFSGGLVGGGGGLSSAFSIISAAGAFSSFAGAISTGAGGLGLSPGALGGAINAGGLGLSPGALGGAISTSSFSSLGLSPGALGGAINTSGFSSNFTSGFSSALSQVQAAGGPLGPLTQSLQSGQLSSVLGDANGAFAGAFDSLPGALSQVQDALPGVVNQINSAGFQNQFASDLASFTSEFPAKLGTLGNYFPPEITSIVTDNVGNITNLALENAGNLPDVASGLLQTAPAQFDNLSNVLNSPNSFKIPLTDIAKQANTGFSIGAMDSNAIAGLNAAITNSVGSLNNPAFIDSVTKSVGKYGFNVQQLQKTGYVRPEAVFNDQMNFSELWTGKNGMSSVSNLLANGQVQDQIQQQLIATDYQSLVNQGGIKSTDGLKETMSMLAASLNSSPEIAALARTGEKQLSVLKNTTNINDPANASSIIEQFMKTGASAADEVQRLVDQNQNVQNYAPR